MSVDGNLTTTTSFKKAKTYSRKSFLEWKFSSVQKVDENQSFFQEIIFKVVFFLLSKFWRRPKYIPENYSESGIFLLFQKVDEDRRSRSSSRIQQATVKCQIRGRSETFKRNRQSDGKKFRIFLPNHAENSEKTILLQIIDWM